MSESDVPRDGYGRPLRGVAPPSPPARPAVRPLRGAANLGFELVGQLQAVGVDSLDRLIDIGPREAWLRLRQQYPRRGTLKTLLALQGAVLDVEATFLPLHVVDDLRAWMARHADDRATPR